MPQHPIAAFLHARLDELEQKARAAIDQPDDGTWTSDESGNVFGKTMASYADNHGQHHGTHIAAHDPAYVLADIAAKRELIKLVFCYESNADGEFGCCHDSEQIAAGQCPMIDPGEILALRALALPFAQHPDHQESWKP